MRSLISLFVSLVIFVIGVVYTLSQPRIYEAKGRVELTQVKGSKSDGKRVSRRVSMLTPQEALGVLKSANMIMGISKRLSTEELERLSTPYADLKDEREIMRILYGSEARTFSLVPDTNIIEVIYRHQNPEIAAILVNTHIKELIDYNLRLNVDFSMKEVEDLRLRTDQQKDVVENLEIELAALEATSFSDSVEELTRIAKLREEFKEEQKLFEALLKKMTTEKTVIHMGPGPIRIIDEATTPEKHISPNIPLWIAGSLLAGLLGGVISFCLIGKFRT